MFIGFDGVVLTNLAVSSEWQSERCAGLRSDDAEALQPSESARDECDRERHIT